MSRRATPCIVAGLVLSALGCQVMDQMAEKLGNVKVSMKLKNGETIEGTLLKEGEGGSLVQIKYGTVTVSTGDVASVEKKGDAPEALPGAGRLAKWDRCVHMIAGRLGALPAQIPATVIDRGIMKNVPYLSHRAGEYEFNVYGDPDQPAGLEVGLYSPDPSDAARKHCLATMLTVLNDAADRNFLMTLSLLEAKETRAGLTFEVTPPTAHDAYGGWWISIYDDRALQRQRASDRELAQISVTRGQVKTAAGSPEPAAHGNGAGAPLSVLRWKEHELRLARPASSGPADQSRVYLRGVHRKNGVYVAPYAS